ncbi:MAG: MBL fold metallo-hydrolase, partial [Nocardioidaceae bacterium]|nr:MBL fold metallo-hydrolase [Nocardioidaceae bacterium]
MSDRTLATDHVVQDNHAVPDELAFDDRRHYEDADRGFIATRENPQIVDSAGKVVWDLSAYEFLDGEAPESVNPSLWRSSQLTAKHGLFKVVDGIYQVRSFDVSNMTVVEGETGYIVIDPLVTAECAAALELVREHLGDRPVTAVIYSHSHADHFGGVKGVISAEDAAARDVPIIAPADFMEHAISENIYAGNVMGRRAAYMFGGLLPRDAQGTVGAGLGTTNSTGTVTLIEPTISIAKTGEELVLDGVLVIFQVTPDTEAPSDMNFYFPQQRAVCLADNVVHTLHNLYTLRGAQIRDGVGWSKYINEVLHLFGDRTDVAFLGHMWPVWGQERINEWLRMQRDIYRYIHDETLRLANQGLTMNEIAAEIELPETLGTYWSNRGYYGTVSHNARAVYQKYLGFFDGNPAHLDPHTPVEAGRRYVELAGGVEALLTQAQAAYDEGDYRWVVELVNHAVFADPSNEAAKQLQATALEQLGYRSESAIWRNFYLTGAMELRQESPTPNLQLVTPDMLAALTTDMVLSYLAIRIVGPRAAQHPMVVNLTVSDTGERVCLELSNGVLVPTHGLHDDNPDACMSIPRGQLALLALGAIEPDQLATTDAVLEGNGELL